MQYFERGKFHYFKVFNLFFAARVEFSRRKCRLSRMFPGPHYWFKFPPPHVNFHPGSLNWLCTPSGKDKTLTSSSAGFPPCASEVRHPLLICSRGTLAIDYDRKGASLRAELTVRGGAHTCAQAGLVLIFPSFTTPSSHICYCFPVAKSRIRRNLLTHGKIRNLASYIVITKISQDWLLLLFKICLFAKCLV